MSKPFGWWWYLTMMTGKKWRLVFFVIPTLKTVRGAKSAQTSPANAFFILYKHYKETKQLATTWINTLGGGHRKETHGIQLGGSAHTPLPFSVSGVIMGWRVVRDFAQQSILPRMLRYPSAINQRKTHFDRTRL